MPGPTPIKSGDAWAEKWRRRCDRKQPWVAVVDGDVAGFIEFDADGHIDCTYVSPDHAGKGYMSAIMEQIFQEARRSNLIRLYAEVSITARPFFERHGFHVDRPSVLALNLGMIDYRHWIKSTYFGTLILWAIKGYLQSFIKQKRGMNLCVNG
ncbi:thioredoxin related protein [Leptolyngbya sp. Heron Island J]|uniref:GNAT family N-acetyltransferase n=1 Tax=Leptolyngbya sp. Heron Island J TaxID=1385935 RepID=UPI0003B9EFE6|nr:GNAT family N-acetyltransferase [Leptolyngbya sp. Heron Island J]ESA35760.1 thioredoxin related protein [Leptolyngbya sp. Heron Island J]